MIEFVNRAAKADAFCHPRWQKPLAFTENIWEKKKLNSQQSKLLYKNITFLPFMTNSKEFVLPHNIKDYTENICRIMLHK